MNTPNGKQTEARPPVLNEIFDVWNQGRMTCFLILGLILGLMVWAIGLGNGFDQGIDSGIQAMETGQVEVVSTQGGFDQYFRLRVLIEGIPGVLATSARLEFLAKITNPQGKSRTVKVRAFGFVAEDKVTAYRSRILHGVSGTEAGLIIPKAWEDGSFLFPSETAALTALNGTWGPTPVPVSGSLERPSVLLGPDTVLLDLETAQNLLGPSGLVSSFAVRLAPGIRAQSWIKDEKEAFTGYGVELKTWSDQSKVLKAQLKVQALPLLLFQYLTVLVSGLAFIILVWRWRTLGLLFLRKKPENISEALVTLVIFFGAVTFATELLQLGFPSWESVLLKSFQSQYPFTDLPQLSWAWGWNNLAAPLVTLGLAFVIQKKWGPQ